MNILHINKFHYLRGGAETVYFKTAELLESHGHKSLFFSMNHPENISCETSDYFMPYVDLTTNGNNITSQFKTAVRILYSFEAKKRLSKLLDQYPVDIAHLHNIHHQISPSILHELKKRKIPVVMTLHDYKMVCASYSMLVNGHPCEACNRGKYFEAVKNRCVKGSFAKSGLAAIEMYMHHKVLDIYNNVDIFISPSLFLKNKLTEMGFRKEIVHLLNFIDIQKMGNGKWEIGGGVTENSIVYLGRLSPEKGLWTLLEAAKRLKLKNNKAEIKIIGDGPIREKLEEKVKAEGIDNVKFLGYMKGEALYKEIKKSIAVVLPSECYETFGLVIIEAFAFGKPVIGSRIGNIPELIKDRETGFTFEPGNAEDLGKKIKALLSDGPLLIEMGKKARKFVEDEFNPEKYYQRLMEIYQRAINGDIEAVRR